MVPAIIAAVAGIASAAASAKSASDKAKAAREANEANAALAAENLKNNKELLDKMYSEQAKTYAYGASQYDDLLKQYQGSNTYDAGEFNYGGSINDFYSPAAQMRINQAMNAIQNSRANAGGMFSSETMDQMNAKAQLMASEEYDKAYDRYMADRSQSLNEWNANQDEQYKAWQSQVDKNKTLLSMADADKRALANAKSDYYTNLVNQNNANLSTTAGINVANANNTTSWLDSVGAGLSVGAGTYSLFK